VTLSVRRGVSALVALLALAALAGGGAAARRDAQVLYVSPTGFPTGTGTQADPLPTIQAALDRAQPGTTIILGPGAYHEEPHTVTDGTKAAPITIQGPEHGADPAARHQATLYGDGRIFNIDNSWYTIRGFTIDGEEKLADTTFPTDVADAAAFKDANQSKITASKLLVVGSDDSARDLTGIVIDDMFFHASGTDCVHLRDGAHGNVIENSVIEWCGMKSVDMGPTVYRYHNGEGVYIGTSPRSTTQPMHADDPTAHNIVRDNRIATYGSECFDVKENAHDNRLVGNQCLDNAEPLAYAGSAIELRGYGNVILRNAVAGSLGYGLKIAADGPQYRNDGNSVRGNVFSGERATTLRITSKEKQGLFCGNRWGVSGDAEVTVPAPPAPVRPGARKPRCSLR
jgi:hypothetical protein